MLCIYFIDVRWRKATERSGPSRINDYDYDYEEAGGKEDAGLQLIFASMNV